MELTVGLEPRPGLEDLHVTNVPLFQLSYDSEMVEQVRIERTTSGLQTGALPAELHVPKWWSVRDSNPRPLDCQSSALPAELTPHRGIGTPAVIAVIFRP